MLVRRADFLTPKTDILHSNVRTRMFEVEVIERNCSADPMELRKATKKTKASQMHLPYAQVGPKGSRALHCHELAGKILRSIGFHIQQSMDTDIASSQRHQAVWGFSALVANKKGIANAGDAPNKFLRMWIQYGSQRQTLINPKRECEPKDKIEANEEPTWQISSRRHLSFLLTASADPFQREQSVGQRARRHELLDKQNLPGIICKVVSGKQ